MNLSHTLRSQPGLIPLKRLATLMGVHYQTVYGWVSLGQVPHVRLGSRIKFDGAKVAEGLEQRSAG
jgi:excisionase family DNA binding protein